MTSKDNIIYYTITAVVFVGIVLISLWFHNAGQSTNGDSETGSMAENISTIVIAAAAVVTAGATTVLALITWRYVRLTDSQLKATYKPQIVVSLRGSYNRHGKFEQSIYVENSGSGIARKIKFGGDLSRRIGNSTPLDRVDFIGNGIDALAPGHVKNDVIVTVKDTGEYLKRYLTKEDYPPISITVTYKDVMDDNHSDEFTLDFGDMSVSR